MTAIGEAFADGVRSWWAPNINGISNPNIRGVDAWLANGGYICVAYNPGQPADNGMASVREVMTLNVASPEGLSHAFASEISRFSCAAYESLLDAEPPAAASKSLGWAVVRHYYASFYCAHALLRISGSALTYISPATAQKINRIAGAYLGILPSLKAGIHVVRFDRDNNQQVTVTRLSAGSGGSHEDMWTVFLEFTKEAEAEIIRSLGRDSEGPNGAAQILEDVRRCFRGAGWASGLRNGVNYRQEHGVWFPWARRERDAVALSDRMRLWKPTAVSGLHLSATEDELIQLADVCNVLVHLMTAVLKDIVKRSRCRNGCFVDRLPFRYLKSRHVAL